MDLISVASTSKSNTSMINFKSLNMLQRDLKEIKVNTKLNVNEPLTADL